MNLFEIRDQIVENVRYVPDHFGIPLSDLVVEARVHAGLMEIAVYDSRDRESGPLTKASMPAQGLNRKMVASTILSAILASAPIAKALAATRESLTDLLSSNVLALREERSA